jgi:hypothetical protein
LRPISRMGLSEAIPILGPSTRPMKGLARETEQEFIGHLGD